MDSDYSFMGDSRDKLPTFENIVLRNIRIMTVGKITLDGFDASHRLGITFDNVYLDQPSKIHAVHAQVTEGDVNFHATGDDVQIAKLPTKSARNTCEGKFVPFPETKLPTR